MQVNYLIIEDERLSAEHLAGMVSRLFPDFILVKTLDSIKTAVKWLSQNEQPQLAFFDIQLADGLSFEIFEQVSVKFPVIFTTAFNEYALRAFKVNSVDYLLKPVAEEELRTAINKFKSNTYSPGKTENESIAQVLLQLTNTYKSRFLVKVGEHIRMVTVEEVSMFVSLEKSTFLRTFNNKDCGVYYTLEQIENLVDPKQFFRVNRKYIINLKAIQDIIAYSNSRLKIKLSPLSDEDIIVSRERVTDFKKWLDGQ